MSLQPVWERDPKFREVMGRYVHTFQFTINDEMYSEDVKERIRISYNPILGPGKGAILEPGLARSLDERLEQAKFIVDTFGVKSLTFRFDPIVTYRIDSSTYFEQIVIYMSKIGINTCVMAFCYNYAKVISKMERGGLLAY